MTAPLAVHLTAAVAASLRDLAGYAAADTRSLRYLAERPDTAAAVLERLAYVAEDAERMARYATELAAYAEDAAAVIRGQAVPA